MDLPGTRTRPDAALPWIRTALISSSALLTTAVTLGWLGSLVWAQPDEGADATGMLALSCFAMSAMALLAGFALAAFATWRRRHPPHPSSTAMWHPDPWHEAPLRYWNGQSWTSFTA
jgi:hypothetical protein